ncbi:DinB family protein [Candidatus Chloroploca sp. M-50]|uniref:DinB family protein n=1 Tax=Candidatus Chloroploca mongolica TaxID=2528176 RepID=A0ABS4D8P3_9CHLR|nr:DinB family protein [Candidatus Chloroploca mongolica]MBP1465814.1 DinB family protein [Candidatus Chloroploca mongolica]
MNSDQEDYRKLLCSTSLGYTAYYVWSLQARRERKYNVSRLLAALSSMKRVRAEQAFRALGEVGKTRLNVAHALAGFEPDMIASGPVTGISTLPRELLERAAQALGEGRDLVAEEMGDLFVCGSCGELMEGAPATCDVCGTVREGFLSFRATESMGTLGPHTIVRQLEQTWATLQALVADLNEEQLATPAVGAASIKEQIGHLTDMDVVFRERAWLILETDNPQLPNAHPPTLVQAGRYRTHLIVDLMEAFHTSRVQTIDLLRGLTVAAWRRTGHHTIFGTIPLTHQGNWVVEHEKGHLIEMAQIRHDLLDQRTLVLPHSMVFEILEGE